MRKPLLAATLAALSFEPDRRIPAHSPGSRSDDPGGVERRCAFWRKALGPVRGAPRLATVSECTAATGWVRRPGYPRSANTYRGERRNDARIARAREGFVA